MQQTAYWRQAEQSLRRRLGPNWRRRLDPDIGEWQDCTTRLDRLGIRSTEFPRKDIFAIPGLKCIRDELIRSKNGKFKPYNRVCEMQSEVGWRLTVEYERCVPWISPCRFTMVANDKTGL